MVKHVIKWFDATSFVSLSGGQSVRDALAAIDLHPEWILVRDLSGARRRGGYHALRIDELQEILANADLDPDESLGSLFVKRKPPIRSFVTPELHPPESKLRGWLGATDGIRLLQIVEGSHVINIGEVRLSDRSIPAQSTEGDLETRFQPDLPPSKGELRQRRGPGLTRPPKSVTPVSDLGPGKGGGWRDGDASDGSGIGRLDATLSAEGPSRLGIKQATTIDFRIAIGDDPSPLASAMIASLTVNVPLTVLLTVHGGAIEIMGPAHFEVEVPTRGSPATGSFEIRGTAIGKAMAAVLFSQGGSQLGAIPLQFLVDGRNDPPARLQGTSAPGVRDLADDDIVDLLVDEDVLGGDLVYRYRLSWRRFGLWQKEFRSAKILDREGCPSTSTRKYVEGIYKQLTERVLRNAADVSQFGHDIAALGTSIGRQLFPRELHEVLYQHRDDLRALRVTAFEPYIPWELARLVGPADNGDDRHLAEYGLIRAHSGLMARRSLPLRDWLTLRGDYTGQNARPVGREIAYLDARLRQVGLTPKSLSPSFQSLVDAVGTGAFDALHIACHGDTSEAHAEDAQLLLAVRKNPDHKDEVQGVSATTLREEAHLSARRPLVFLNACESGRQGPLLTAWGGWPSAFLEAGAGAFVGTAWPVRDVPASKFAQKFYDRLLSSTTLVEATTAARAEAKQSGDASWLAFKVYGDPAARRS